MTARWFNTCCPCLACPEVCPVDLPFSQPLETMELSAFGWTTFFEKHSTRLRELGLEFDRISFHSRGVYNLYTRFGERRARLSGSLPHQITQLIEMPL